MSELALRLIEENMITQDSFLDLGNCGLIKLPIELFSCNKWLTELNLGSMYFHKKERKWVKTKNNGNKNSLTIKDLKSLSNLSNLQALYLSGNQNQYYDFLFIHLQDLDLDENIIQNVSFLQKFTNLRTLDLSCNQIQDISYLQNLTQLQELYLNSNQIQDISCLQNLTQLQELYLNSNQIQDISYLQNLTKLQELYLNSNHIKDYSSLLNLSQLQTLDLSYNRIYDISFFKNLTQLEHLYISNNKIQDYSFLNKYIKLRTLHISHNNIENISFLQSLTQLQILYINNNNIDDYTLLKSLVKLQTLYINNNNIKNISFLKNLKQLETLNLSDNKVQDISYLQNLIQLKFLNISNNQISDISYLQNLEKLQFLYFSYNKIHNISFLQNLINLQDLYANNNQIYDISFLQNLTQLKFLNISNNQISDINYLQNLSKLQSLSLHSNIIKNIPSLVNLLELNFIDLSNNKIQDIKPLLMLLIVGIEMDLNGNPITNPPIEIVRQGAQAIIRYFEQIDKEGQDYIYEAKLTLVGDGGAGKTSLQTRILDVNAPLPEHEKRTRGIVITQWFFDTLENKRFIAHIWDFGGQDVYFPVHRFFLTENCVFVLLGSTRTAIHNFEYWIPTIYQFGGKSPVILVQNCFDGNEANWNELDVFFSNMEFNLVKPIYRINLPSKNKGLSLLEAAIKFQITQLPHIGEAVPKSWVKVRAKLAALARKQPFISFDKFLKICQETDKENLTNPKVTNMLGRFFHDLGIILWFHDKANLQDWVILQPHWVMNAVYKIIDDTKIQTQNGNILNSDFIRLWSDDYYKEKQHLLKQLLEVFKIAFPKKSKKTDFILPARLLPIPEEKKENNITDNIRLEYHFNFMPRGIVNQISADLSRYINKDDNVWNNAVTFTHDDSKAQVLEDIFNRIIFIKADGINARGLMLTINKSLDDILEDYKGIRFVKKVPCSCNICQKLDTPTLFEHDKLKLWLKDNDEVFCNESRSKLSIKYLLYNVGLETLKSQIKEIKNNEKGDIYNFHGPILGNIGNIGSDSKSIFNQNSNIGIENKKEEKKEDRILENFAVKKWKMVSIWWSLIALAITILLVYIYITEPESIIPKDIWKKFKGSAFDFIFQFILVSSWTYFIFKMIYERFLDPSKETNFRALWKSKNKE